LLHAQTLKKHEDTRPNREIQVEEALKKHIILCTGPAFDKKRALIENVEKDYGLIQFKKIFLETQDPHNIDVSFSFTKPVIRIFQNRGKQLDCLNAIIYSILDVCSDQNCHDDDIIIFKHESVIINDMYLVRKCIGKILDGYDMVIKLWLWGNYRHSDSFYLKVSSARKFLKDLSEVSCFTKECSFCEDYLTKYIVNRLPKVFKIGYTHSSWQDNELGFYHIPSFLPDPANPWDKRNYYDIFK
jgi:hypothetical protein